MKTKKPKQKNDLKKIAKLADLLSVINMANPNGKGIWPHEIGFRIIALDGEINVLCGTDAPDELYDALYAIQSKSGIQFDISGDMGYNPIYYTDIYHDSIHGGPNEWWVD